MEKLKNIKSVRFLEYWQTKINGEFDFAAEVEYNKSQVAESEATSEALSIANKELSKHGLSCRVNKDVEQMISANSNNVTIVVGLDLYNKKE